MGEDSSEIIFFHLMYWERKKINKNGNVRLTIALAIVKC